MSIQYRLLIAFLTVAVVPLTAVQWLNIWHQESILEERVIEKLNGVASVKQSQIQNVIDRNLERLSLIASRTKLRLSLQEYLQTKRLSDKETMQKILLDAVGSISDLDEAFIVNRDGTFIVSSKPGVDYGNVASSAYFARGLQQQFLYAERSEHVLLPQVTMAGPIALNDESLGVIVVRAYDNALVKAVKDYTGLGETGETLLAMRDHHGDAKFLVENRFENASLNKDIVLKTQTDVPITRALLKQETVFTDTIDYRGMPVLSAIRYLPEVDWGIVVKRDKAEAFAPLVALRHFALLSTILAIVLAAFVSYLFARSLSRPLQQLRSVVADLSDTDWSVEADETAPGEIGMLGKAFNTMRDKLKKTYVLLQDEIENAHKFQRAVEGASSPIAIVDPDLTIVYTNPSWNEQLECDKDIYGRSLNLFISDKTNEDERRMLLRTLQDGQELQSENFILERRGGGRLNAEFCMYPIGTEGSPSFYVVMFHDITKRKRADATKTDFVSLASHQLRTPLTCIRWVFEICQKNMDTFPPEHRDVLHEGGKAAEHMREIIQTILMLAQVESKKFKIDATSIALKQLILDIEEEQKASFADRHQVVTLECDENLTISSDKKALREVIANLITNAHKYTPHEGSITVTAKKSDDMVQIQVQDTGMGIPKHLHKKVFTRFFRGDNVVGKEPDGSGLGLHLVKSLVKLLKGDISFDSIENKGTTFTVLVPQTFAT